MSRFDLFFITFKTFILQVWISSCLALLYLTYLLNFEALAFNGFIFFPNCLFIGFFFIYSWENISFIISLIFRSFEFFFKCFFDFLFDICTLPLRLWHFFRFKSWFFRYFWIVYLTFGSFKWFNFFRGSTFSSCKLIF